LKTEELEITIDQSHVAVASPATIQEVSQHNFYPLLSLEVSTVPAHRRRFFCIHCAVQSSSFYNLQIEFHNILAQRVLNDL
jgi:hypothetical protein